MHTKKSKAKVKGLEMYRATVIIVALPMLILLVTPIQAQPGADSDGNNKAKHSGSRELGVPTIALTGLEVTDKTLELRYKIKNVSEHDIWILDEIDQQRNFESYLPEGVQTLLIRRRFDLLPLYGYRNPPIGCYVRLRAGEEWAEVLLFPLPVVEDRLFGTEPSARGRENARSLVVEVGYYAGDLPAMIHQDRLRQAEETRQAKLESADERWWAGLFYFDEWNEGLRDRRDRNEQVVVHYFPHQRLKGAQVFRIRVEGVLIPYDERDERGARSTISPPDLSACTRLEIRYQPSMLGYFFPYEGQQSLLSPAEKELLQSMKTVVVENHDNFKAFAHEISSAFHVGATTERSSAHVACYRDGGPITSFAVYDDMSIVTEENDRFMYPERLRSLKRLTLQIQPFELRMQCAVNLRDFWYRSRSYHKIQMPKDSPGKSEIMYPSPAKWCDAMVRTYQSIGMSDKNVMRPHMCPSAGEGKCHYGMNPDCKFDSPPDMVLLFETKAGWNQHGGLELFTFDNHDPKGGCVLLNDCTVKFIRTKEELQQLRWK